MDDIKILETCPKCGEHLTLMESISMIDNNPYLVKRCLKCGEYPVTEIAELKTDRPNCATAEWVGGKCCGYGKGEFDDEPIDACKNCPKQACYGIE